MPSCDSICVAETEGTLGIAWVTVTLSLVWRRKPLTGTALHGSSSTGVYGLISMNMPYSPDKSTASILETEDEGSFSVRDDVSGHSWDSSQICVTYCPVVTREPYCSQGTSGADEGTGDYGGGCRQPDGWLGLLVGWGQICRKCYHLLGTSCLQPSQGM